MVIRQILLGQILVMLAPLTAGKFHQIYNGIAAQGVQSCLVNSDFTPETITLRQNCLEAFKCVMENISNQSQSILSSGSAILGFLPTVLLTLGNTNGEIVRINARFPILAFFLSITNINKRPNTQKNFGQYQTKGTSMSLGLYGSVGQTPTSSNSSMSWAHFASIVLAHVLVGTGAAVVVYQSVDLGRKSVVSWACWTDWYPVLWVCFGAYHHNLSVVCMRLSLDIHAFQPSSASHAPLPSPSPSPFTAVQPAILAWDLTGQLYTVVAHKRFARWSKALVDLLNNINYLYGTAIFSSSTLVSGRNAINNLAIYGAVAVVDRMVGLWVLEEMGGPD